LIHKQKRDEKGKGEKKTAPQPKNREKETSKLV
jgi:hypothetical protein